MSTPNRHAAPRQSHPVRTIIGGIIGSAAVAVGLLFVTAACGSTTPTTPAAEAPPVSGADTTAGTGTDANSSDQVGIATATSPLGTIVTSDGYTLYRFSKDSADPPKSTCAGNCAKTWPPVLGDGVPVVNGLPSESIGTVGRPDGTQQLTLDGWPLYRYAKDAQPGDTKGEGVGGTWKAIGINGKPAAGGAKAPAPPAASAVPVTQAPAPADSGSDYGSSSSGY